MRKITCVLCGEPAAQKLCDACKSWWYRVQVMTPGELAGYADRFRLRHRRMDGRSTRLGP